MSQDSKVVQICGGADIAALEANKSPTEAMNLAFLSGDILAQIARYDCVSPAILALWKCGNTVLSKKIEDWVDEIDLEDQNMASTSRYPKFLSSLHRLRILRLVRFGQLASDAMLSEEIQKLSSMLTELTVSAVRADALFLFFPDSAQDDNTRSPIMLSDNTSYCRWSTKFPHLRKLVVERCCEEIRIDWQAVEITDTLLSLLPPTIEHLVFAVATLTATRLDVLPSLHTLEVFCFSSEPTTWPPHLTRLMGRTVDVWDFKCLPRTLTTLPQGPHHEPHLHEILPLPPSLTQLILSSVTGISTLRAHGMPSQLTSLSMRYGALKAGHLLALPPCLTSLKIEYIDWESIATYLDSSETEIDYDKFWPRTLRHLNIAVEDYVIHRDTRFGMVMGALPTSLTVLVWMDDWSDFGLDWHRPPFSNLKSCTLASVNTFPTHLTTSLEHLELRAFEYESGRLSFLQTSSLTTLSLQMSFRFNPLVKQLDELIGCLPRNLKSLSIRQGRSLNWTPEGCSLLPASLTQFEVNCPAPPSVLHFLPPKLKKLELTLTESPTASDILAMPCYHHLRSLCLCIPEQNVPLNTLENVWPESALHNSTFNYERVSEVRRNALMARNVAYPDPRVLELTNAR